MKPSTSTSPYYPKPHSYLRRLVYAVLHVHCSNLLSSPTIYLHFLSLSPEHALSYCSITYRNKIFNIFSFSNFPPYLILDRSHSLIFNQTILPTP
eukprot:sb/3479262/